MSLFEDKYDKRMEKLGFQELQGEIDFRNTYVKKEYIVAAKGIFDRTGRGATIEELIEIMI